MVRTSFKVGAGVVALLSIGAVLLGPSLLGNLYRSAQEKVRDKAQEYVEPDVLLRDALSVAESELPRTVSAIKAALEDTGRQIAVTGNVLHDEQEGLRLIEQDLEQLAAKLTTGEGCELRGRQFAPQEVEAEAARLLEKKKQYEVDIRSRENLLDKLCRQERGLQQQLAKAEQAMADLAHKTRQVQSRIALVKSAERIEQIDKIVEGPTVPAVPSSLEQLDRQLERRWRESEERMRMRGRLEARDQYMEAVKKRQLQEELSALYPAEDRQRDGQVEKN